MPKIALKAIPDDKCKGVIPVGVPLLSRANDRARELGVDTLNAGPRGGKEKLGHLGLASDGRATQMIFIFGWVALSVLVGDGMVSGGSCFRYWCLR